MEIQDYPGYFIYRDGRVWSDKLCRGVKGRFLKHRDNKGYKNVNLCKDGKTNNKFIHQLIALHYIPNPNNYPHVDHINRIRHDNRIENLRWCNHTMNMNNMSVKKNNKCGIKNISYHPRDKLWCFSKTYMGERHRKHFKTLDEAIKYKESYIKSLNLELL